MTYNSTAASTSFLQQTGGNPDLKNEKSDAYSIGGVLTPRFIPRFSLSVDYINVKLKKAISAFSASQVLNACYDAPDPASNPFCDLFTRNPGQRPAYVRPDQLLQRRSVALSRHCRSLGLECENPVPGRAQYAGLQRIVSAFA